MTDPVPVGVVGWAAETPAGQGLDAAQRALVGIVVEDWVGTYFGGPMAMTREDAVRYTVEGHLKELTAARGYDIVRDTALEYLTAFPETLHTRLTDGQRAVRARTRRDRAEIEGRAGSEAFAQGRYDEALRRVDTAELLDPAGRDYDAIRARIRAAAGAATGSAVGDPPEPAATTAPPMAMSSPQTPDAQTDTYMTADAVGELFVRLDAAGRALESLRNDLDAARRMLRTVSDAPAGAATTSVVVTALDLIEAAMEAAARWLEPAVAGWEQVDLGWRTLSAAVSTMLTADAAFITDRTRLSLAEVERVVLTVLENALTDLERAVTRAATWVERSRSALAANPAEVEALPAVALGFEDIWADFARLRAELAAPAVEREKLLTQAAPASLERAEAEPGLMGSPPDAARQLRPPSTAARAALVLPDPPPVPPAAPPPARVSRPVVKR